MARRLYNPETDGEEILNILDDLEDEDDLAREIDATDALDLVLSPPIDGQDSDIDDGDSDCDGREPTYHDIGKGVLRQHIEVCGRKAGERLDLLVGKQATETNDVTVHLREKVTDGAMVGAGDSGLPASQKLTYRQSFGKCGDDRPVKSGSSIVRKRADNRRLPDNACVGDGSGKRGSSHGHERSDEQRAPDGGSDQRSRVDGPAKRRKRTKEQHSPGDSISDNESLEYTGSAASERRKQQRSDGASNSKQPQRDWRKRTLIQGAKFPVEKPTAPNIIKEWREKKITPVEVFKTIMDESIVSHLCRQTEIYAALKGKELHVTLDDMYTYLSILILSGYLPVAHRRMFWETRPDTHNAMVAGAMWRNKFDAIHRYFHVNDNSKIDPEDRLYKIRPLLDHLNEKFVHLAQPLGDKFSIDEAMEPYYGHHYAKQFIRGKPIRCGFKWWCLTTSYGFLLRFRAYMGSETREPGIPLGTSVTQMMCDGLVPPGSTIFIDNYFTSLRLLESLSEKNIFCIGTIRKDRIENAPLKGLEKSSRGSYDALQDTQSKIALIRWRDNNIVTVATNVNQTAVFGQGQCRRWKKGEKKHGLVPQPSVVQQYNKYMGGVDSFDKYRGQYRLRIRKKAWYFPHVRFCINAALVNGWLLYRLVDDIPMLEFLRRTVIAILSYNPVIYPHMGKVIPKSSSQVPEVTRYDGKDHFVDSIETQRRCGQCKKCVKFICLKCNIGLHPKTCFALFHRQN